VRGKKVCRPLHNLPLACGTHTGTAIQNLSGEPYKSPLSCGTHTGGQYRKFPAEVVPGGKLVRPTSGESSTKQASASRADTKRGLSAAYSRAPHFHWRVGPVTKAKFRRECTRCGNWMEPGTPIEHNPEGWTHAECTPETNDWQTNLKPARDDNPWEGSETIDEHEHQDGFAQMTRNRIEYLVCFTCEKEFLRHGRKIVAVQEIYDAGEFAFDEYGAEAVPIQGYGAPMHPHGSDPWGNAPF
jgi:hypothetical protein